MRIRFRLLLINKAPDLESTTATKARGLHLCLIFDRNIPGKLCRTRVIISHIDKLLGVPVQAPFSRDEQAAMARYVSAIKEQLQHVVDVVAARYGRESDIGELAVKALTSSTCLERELLTVEEHFEAVPHLHSRLGSSQAIY